MPYPYRDLPLTPTSAAPLIIEKLRASTRPTKRAELVAFVTQRHGELGGLPAFNAVGAVKKALQTLVEDKQIETRGAQGYYSLSSELVGGPVTEGASEYPAQLPIPPELDEELTPEETLGEGAEIVYVYFNESERELARFKGKDYWPCKVGFSSSNLQSRILGQGVPTAMARLPTVGLVIRTSSGHRLERAIHFALDEAEARIGEAGTEWFQSSPARIKAWYLSHCVSVRLFQEGLTLGEDA